jgi:hypothetical protein
MRGGAAGQMRPPNRPQPRLASEPSAERPCVSRRFRVTCILFGPGRVHCAVQRLRLDRRDQVHWRNDLLAATCTRYPCCLRFPPTYGAFPDPRGSRGRIAANVSRRGSGVRATATPSACFTDRPSLARWSSNHAVAHAIATATSIVSISAIALAASSVMRVAIRRDVGEGC